MKVKYLKDAFLCFQALRVEFEFLKLIETHPKYLCHRKPNSFIGTKVMANP